MLSVTALLPAGIPIEVRIQIEVQIEVPYLDRGTIIIYLLSLVLCTRCEFCAF